MTMSFVYSTLGIWTLILYFAQSSVIVNADNKFNLFSANRRNPSDTSSALQLDSTNRDDCLRKLICGLLVQDSQGSSESGRPDQAFGNYAQVIDNFFKDEDPMGNVSQESIELLEDYSVSLESGESVEPQIGGKLVNVDNSEEEGAVPTAPSTPEALQISSMETTIATQAVHGIDPKSQSRPAESTSPIHQKQPMVDLAALVQEAKYRNNVKIIGVARDRDIPRTGHSMRILKAAVGSTLDQKLEAVRQCQQIIGCPFTFKQMYLKYGGQQQQATGKNPAKTNRRPMRPKQRPRPQMGAGIGTRPVDFASQMYAQRQKEHYSYSAATAAALNADNFAEELFHEGIGRPFSKSQPQQDNKFLGLGGFLKDKQPNLQYAPSQDYVKVNRPTKVVIRNPYPQYQYQKVSEKPQPPRRQIYPQLGQIYVERVTTTTTPIPPPPPPPFKGESAVSLRKVKRPGKKEPKRPRPKPNPEDDEDENDDLNEKIPIELVGNPDHDAAVAAAYDSVSNESDEHDDYDEEKTSDEEDDDLDDDDLDESDEDDENKRIPEKRKKKNKSQKKKSESEEEFRKEMEIGTPDKSESESSKTIVSPPAFPATSAEKRNRKNHNTKENEENSSEEANDDHSGSESIIYKDAAFLTQIGGRPIFPANDVPISMSFGSSMPQALPYQLPVRPVATGPIYSRPPPIYPQKSRPALPIIHKPTSIKSSAGPAPSQTKNENSQQNLKSGNVARPNIGTSSGLLGSVFKYPFSDIFPTGSALTMFNNMADYGGKPKVQPVSRNPQHQHNTMSPHANVRTPLRIPPGPASNNFKREDTKQSSPSTFSSSPKEKIKGNNRVSLKPNNHKSGSKKRTKTKSKSSQIRDGRPTNSSIGPMSPASTNFKRNYKVKKWGERKPQNSDLQLNTEIKTKTKRRPT